MTYVALLRGINMTGHKMIRMADLARLLDDLRFKNVRTYIQSGNVVFEYNAIDSSKIAARIEKKIRDFYGFEVKVFIRTTNQLRRIISRSPFAGVPGIDIEKLCVTFLSDTPDKQTSSSLDLKKDRSEKFKILGKEVYLYLPNGFGKSKLNTTAFERGLNTKATSRNWKTTLKLLELSTMKNL
jgi:uncharacterized protein (DUF1697 family)